MYLAQAQPDIRLTENLLSLISGSQKISLVKIIFMPNIINSNNKCIRFIVFFRLKLLFMFG